MHMEYPEEVLISCVHELLERIRLVGKVVDAYNRNLISENQSAWIPLP